MSNKYNGWTNYATWRVNRDVFNGLHLDIYCGRESVADAMHEGDAVRVVSDALRKFSQKCFGDIFANDLRMWQGTTPNGVTWPDVVRMFCKVGFSDVNWREIAAHVIEDHATDLEEAYAEQYGVTTTEAASVLASNLEFLKTID
jgi:hypothetical protein